MIDKRFAYAWLAWWCGVFVALFVSNGWVGFGVLAAFAPLEAAGLVNNNGLKDQLSQQMTWAFKRLAKEETENSLVPLGWAGWLLGMACLIGALFSLTLIRLVPDVPGLVAWGFGAILVAWNYPHWHSPWRFG